MNPLNLRKQLHDNNSDMLEYVNDIKQWGAEMKQKEEANKSKVVTKTKDATKETAAADKNKIEDETNSSKQSKKVKDYKFWDTYDADDECEKIYETEKSEKSDSESDLTEDSEVDQQIKCLAESEKKKGNTLFGEGKYEDAIKCYTNAIDTFFYDPVYYANRALCHLKLKHFSSAEKDCSMAIDIDKSYVKAFHRRAIARNALGKFKDAQHDLERSLFYDPTNKESQKLLDEIMTKLGETQTTEVSTQRPISKFTLSRQKQKEQMNHTSQTANKVTEAIKENVVERKLPAKPSTSKALIENKPTITNKFKQTIPWPSGNDVVIVDSINKPPNNRANARLKRIQVYDVDMKTEKNISGKLNQYKSSVVAKPVEVKTGETQKISIYEKKIPEKIKLNNFEDLNYSVDISNEDFSKLQRGVPTTSVQFYSNWKDLKEKEIKFLYFRQICPTAYNSIFKESLETKIFSEIIHILANDFVEKNVHVFEYLYGLSKVKRFSTLVMFKTSADKQGLLKLIDFMRTDSRHTKDEVDYLIKKYEM